MVNMLAQKYYVRESEDSDTWEVVRYELLGNTMRPKVVAQGTTEEAALAAKRLLES